MSAVEEKSPAELYRDQAGQLKIEARAFIGGDFTASASGKTFDCISPIDGQVIAQVASCEQEDVDRAVAKARAAFDKGDWAQMNPRHRKKIMLKFADLLEKNAAEIALLETLDMGKPIGFFQSD